jgi:hypothetical protein
MTFELKSIDLSQGERREAGWILLEGLLKLGPTWIKENSTMIHKLFRSIFSAKMCQVEQVNIDTHLEVILQELKLKKRGLACLKLFIDTVDAEQMKRVVANEYLANAITFVMPNSTYQAVYRKFFQTDYTQAKSDLLGCFSKVPAEFYSKCFVTMLHPICQIIVSEPTPLFQSATFARKHPIQLLKKFLFDEDIKICTKAIFFIEEQNCLNTPYSHRENVYKSYAQKRLPLLFDSVEDPRHLQLTDDHIFNSEVPLTQQRNKFN